MESGRFTLQTEARYCILFSAKNKKSSPNSPIKFFKIHFNILSSTFVFKVFSFHQFSIRIFMLSWPPLRLIYFSPFCFIVTLLMIFSFHSLNRDKILPNMSLFDALKHYTFYCKSLLDFRLNHKQWDHPLSAVRSYFSGIFLSTLVAYFIRKLLSRAAMDYS